MRAVAITVGAIGVLFGALAFVFRDPDRALPVDHGLDALAEAKPSGIPGAGLGLYAKVFIPKGSVIGHYGGVLKKPGEASDSSYLVQLEPCAMESLFPFKYADGKENGGQVTRINFAPRTINGVETHLQTAAIDTICEPPYVLFRAIADIAPGTEIFASYGPKYHYDFMAFPAVRQHFCKAVNVDCSAGFTFEP